MVKKQTRRDLLQNVAAGVVLSVAGTGASSASPGSAPIDTDELQATAVEVAANSAGVPESAMELRNDGVASWSTLGERYYEAKIWNTRDSEYHRVLLDGNGAEVDRATLDEREEAAYERTYGKLAPELHEKRQNADPADTFEVAVFLADAKTGDVYDAVGVDDRPIDAETKREITAEYERQTESIVSTFVNAASDVAGVDLSETTGTNRVVSATATATALDRLENKPGVERIMEYPEERHLDIDHATSTIRTNSSNDSTYNMSGYPVGHVEFDHPYTSAAINVAGKWWDGGSSGHPSVTAEALASHDDSLPGAAHDADVYTSDDFFNTDSTSGGTYSEKMDWLYDNSVTTVTESVSFSASTREMGTWDLRLNEDIRKKWLNYCSSAGNYGSDSSDAPVNDTARAFNVIACGNTNDQDDSDWSNDEITSGSCWQDPLSEHADSSSDSDADYPIDKPEVSGPAGHSTAPSNTSGFGGGTSMATPMVAGVAGLLSKFSDDFGTTDFRYFPEAVKPILMVSAINDAGSYAREGAGTVSADAARQVVNNGDFILDTYSESNSQQTYDVDLTTAWWRDGGTVRLCVCWLSDESEANYSDTADIHSDVDLDIRLNDPNGDYVGSSYEWDSTFEWIETSFPTDGTYTLDVNKYSWENSSSSKYIGIAWYVV